jgi:hypothetical protein
MRHCDILLFYKALSIFREHEPQRAKQSCGLDGILPQKQGRVQGQR